MSPIRSMSSFASGSDSDDMEEASLLSSPPRSCQRTSRLSADISNLGISQSTPSNRRLFGDPETAPSPPPRPGATRRPRCTSATEAPVSPNEGNVRRKRSSAERRGTTTTNNANPNATTAAANSNSTADQSMYASPKMSPNSFITMDGRFVQSKNPFSSPMVTDTDAASGNNSTASDTEPAPTLPSFYNQLDAQRPNGFLPPRHSRKPPPSNSTPVSAYPTTADLLDQTGYPLKRFSFTGSPVREHVAHSHTDMMMETDTATSGSLSKVRRLHHSDDVVAASGHDMKSRRLQHLQVQTAGLDDMPSEISPTDVLSFPPAAPTKARPNRRPLPPYARLHPREPQTPVAERRRRVVAARTPHPGSMVMHNGGHHHHHHHNDRDNGDNSSSSGQKKSKSRFTGDFDIISHLGKGSFGTVYKVLSRLDGCMYAIKVAERKAKGPSDRDRMLKEVYALAALSDQADTATFHIVRYHQAWMEDDRLYIQTELCTGTLANEVTQGRMTEARRYKLLRELCMALNFIHHNNMVHLDIKKDNIFLKNDQFKLGDFGLVSTVSTKKDVEEGDSRYMSMELLSGDHTDLTKSDIFSLGATLYEICLGRELPMNGSEWQDIRAGRFAYLSATPELVALIHRMMNPVAAERPTARQLLQHDKLLSDEQKALIAEKSKVRHATMQLAEAKFHHHHQMPAAAVGPSPPQLPRKGGLTRANTWNGSSLPYI